MYDCVDDSPICLLDELLTGLYFLWDFDLLLDVCAPVLVQNLLMPECSRVVAESADIWRLKARL